MLPSLSASAGAPWSPPAPINPERADPLRLRPAAEPVHYEARSCWESYAGPDTYQTSTITKHLSISGQPLAEGRVALAFRTSPPVLTKPQDLESLETLALRLAALYAHVVVQAAPTGRFEALLNHAGLLQTWQALAQSLRESTTAEDRITPAVLDAVAKRLLEPGQVLCSLDHDYVYAALVPGFYGQPLGGVAPSARSRAFSQFFDELPLHFHEQIMVLPSVEEEWLTLECRGTLDAQQTNVAAITALMTKATGAAADTATGQALAPHFHYAATHVLERATGLPRHVELTVYGRLAERYNKQYSLTISRLP